MPFTDPDPELRTVTVPRPPPPPPPVQPPPTAPPAAQPHPTQPTAAAPTQVSDAASGGGYGQPVTKVAPVLISDAASSGGYGTRYYTYRAEAERALKLGQKVGFTTGRGYYLYYPNVSADSPKSPSLAPSQSPGPGTIQTTSAGGDATVPAASANPAQTVSDGGRALASAEAQVSTIHRDIWGRDLNEMVKTEEGRIALAYYFFVEAGFTAVQAAALVGNMAYESTNFRAPGSPKLVPSLRQIGGGGIGILQWTYQPRKDGLFALAKEMGLPWENFGVQLSYVWQELHTTYASTLSALRNATSIEVATQIVEQRYTQNQDSSQVGSNAPKSASYWGRLADAKSIYAQFW